MIAAVDGKKLLALARDAVSSRLKNTKLVVPDELKSRFSEKQGAFVTITKKGELRGCIGFTERLFPLYETILKAAQAAAFHDPRFLPVQESELTDLKFEISALTVPEKIAAKKPADLLKQVKVGKDGLIVKSGFFSGLLLPQVATEYGWNAGEFLSYTCQKAGLPVDSWKNPDCEVYKFQAQIFSEK